MEQIIKQLRKCENVNLLVITQDDDFAKEVHSVFDCTKNLEITNSNKEALELCNETNFDAVIVDTKSDNFIDFFDKINKLKITPLKIVVLDPTNEEDIKNAINCDAYTILSKPFDMINLKLSVIMSLNQTNRNDKIKLGQGFYFDMYRDRVYNKNHKSIELTKLEFGLLKLIIENTGNIVDYDTIEKKVWKGKKMSIFTMRNVVNKVRTKTYYNIFKNASSEGYIIN